MAIARRVRDRKPERFRKAYRVTHPTMGSLDVWAEHPIGAKLEVAIRWGVWVWDDLDVIPCPTPHIGPVKVYR